MSTPLCTTNITYQKKTKVLKKFTELNFLWMCESIFLFKANKQKHIRKEFNPCLGNSQEFCLYFKKNP